ncbi:MAG: ATP-binding protein [Actinobacteria bacterium]|nr:ATP-binding protein [Actinomycetota bacterium]
MRSFEASRDAPACVRHWLAHRLPADSREAATLAASEVVTNALMHGRMTADEQIEVAVIAGDARVRVSVTHRGEAFATTPARAPGAHGGWGLRVVESVTHAWGVERDGPLAIVWFEV